MKLYYDFHIHSGLSPCSSEDMSPNNIVNMSLIKGLDAIAVTDHNGIANVKTCIKIGEQLGLIVVPGMELQTIEDVHLIVLFKTFNQLENFFNSIIDKRLLIPHKPAKFGDQFIYDEEDGVMDTEKYYLITPFNIGLNKVVEMVNQSDGVVFPAHINRNSYSIIKNLGFIDRDLNIKNIEWYGKRPEDAAVYEKKMFKTYRELINSDAHELVQISEKEHYLDVNEKTIDGIFEILNKEV